MDGSRETGIYNHPAGCREPVLGGIELFKQSADVGEMAPDFTIRALDNELVTLSSLPSDRFIVLEFGSITCPVTVLRMHEMERVALTFDNLGVLFAFIYVRESDPGQNYPHHTSFEQKIEHARKTRDIYGVARSILVDDLDGTAHLLYGGVDSMTYVLNKNKLVVYKQYYTDPGLLTDVLWDVAVIGVPTEVSGQPLGEDDYECVYYEGVRKRPISPRDLARVLNYNGPEAVASRVNPHP